MYSSSHPEVNIKISSVKLYYKMPVTGNIVGLSHIEASGVHG